MACCVHKIIGSSDLDHFAFEPGTTVLLVALISRHELNGRHATIHSFNAEKGRCAVNVDGEPEHLAIKPVNLQAAPECVRLEGLSEMRINGLVGVMCARQQLPIRTPAQDLGLESCGLEFSVDRRTSKGRMCVYVLYVYICLCAHGCVCVVCVRACVTRTCICIHVYLYMYMYLYVHLRTTRTHPHTHKQTHTYGHTCTNNHTTHTDTHASKHIHKNVHAICICLLTHAFINV